MPLFLYTTEPGSEKLAKQAAHRLLKMSLATEFGESEFVLVYPQPTGRPFLSRRPTLPVLHFSLSHTDGLAVCAVSDSVVGVDAEPLLRAAPKVAQKYFSAEEQQFTALGGGNFARLWTLKEAYGKFTGEGVMPALRMPFIKHGKPKLEVNGCRLAFVEGFEKHVVTLAVGEGADLSSLVHKRFEPAELGL